ncbi:MAG: iron-containing alcohol dehydrogenase [Candidatus Korarchaeum sp.]|nr:iron-containing alcohol dehydrogenase [Candidatus Korarchaeum sp.]
MSSTIQSGCSELENKKGLERIESPRYIFFGPNAISKVEEVLRSLNIRSPILLISGPSVTKAIAEDLASSLEPDYRILHVTTTGGLEDLMDTISKARKSGVDLLIGVGGGKPLDITKVVASELGVRYIVVPTAASHDGIASPSVSFTLSREIEVRLGRAIRVEAPTAILADTTIINRASPITFKSGFGDLVAKITAVRDWELAYKLRDEPYSEYAASMSLLSAKIAMDHAHEIRTRLEESTRILVKALIGSGVAMSIAGSSRPASGSEHMFSHALDILSSEAGAKPAPHGIQVAIGTIMMAYLQGQDWKMIKDKLIEAGVPTTAEEAGISPDMVVKALTIAHKVRERYTILGSSGLTLSAAEKLARVTGVIR